MNQHISGETIERTLPEPLQELLEHSTDLTDSKTARLKELLYDYQHVFSLTEGDLGTTQTVKHRIETGNVPPIRQQPRRTSPWKHDEIERQVAGLLHQGRVTELSSPWSSPVVLVTKKDGSQRLCVDYRQLNVETVKDAFPLPRVDDSPSALSGSRWFSTLDLASGYWQVDTDAPDHEIGAVFSQLQEGVERPIAFTSRTLYKSERNYCVTRRELLAIVEFVKQHQHYLQGARFCIRTDHAPLRSVMNAKDPEGQLARWIEFLSTFDFEIQYRVGERHQNADALSRRPCNDDCRWCKKWRRIEQIVSVAVQTKVPLCVARLW